MRRSKDSPYWGQQGFTLLELLLALMMFALIAGAIFAAFAAITDGVEKGRQSGEIYRVARGAIQHLTQELGAAFQLQVQCLEDAPSYICEPLKGEDAEVDSRPRDRLMFLTIPYQHFPEGRAANEVCNVCYYIAENTQKVPALFRYENCTLGKKDSERCSGQQEPLELTDAVVGLNVTYYDADLKDHKTWPAEDAQGSLPCRVHVALVVRRPQGDEQVFTTMVTLPMGTCERQTQNDQTAAPATPGTPGTPGTPSPRR